MKILFVSHRYPPRTGGVETHVQEIATRLVERGHEVTVFSADAGEDVPTESTYEGVRVRRFRSISHNGAFYFAPQIAVEVYRCNADVVHAHNYHAFPLFFAAIGVTDERFVVTTHYHGESTSRIRNALLSLYRYFGRQAVRESDAVIAVSQWEQTQLRADFGVDATVIPNGVDVERFGDSIPEPRTKPYLLVVGRIVEYKGFQHAIRALPEMPEYDLLVVGTGPYRHELERIAKEAGVADRVEFLGYVASQRLSRLYAGADVFLHFSEFEAYGITVAEALSAGTPCVVRREGALTDWTTLRGCTGISELGPKQIVDAVGEVVENDPNVDLPTWDDVVSSLLKVYSTDECEPPINMIGSDRQD